MDILVTDVTEMSGSNYCVAGWDATAKRMVRPLPNGGHWPEALILKYKIQTGAVLTVTPQGTATGSFPHLTEDTPINVASIKSKQTNPDWMGSAAPPVSASLNAGFSSNLKWNSTFQDVHQGVYVPTGVQCNSLIAVKINKAALSFSQPFDKLKATLNDGAASYQLPVSSHILKEAWRQGGVEMATSLVPDRGILHVRLGLAREFAEQPDRCYLMVNGIL